MSNLKFACVLEVEFCENQTAGATLKQYHYFAPDYIQRNWKPGDYAIAFGQGGRKCLVEVKAVLALDADHRATRPIIGFGDISAHQQREADRKRYDELVAKLEEMDRQRKERQRWAELAADDDAAKAVVKELNQLEGNF